VKYLTLTNGKSMFCYQITDGKIEVLMEFPL